MVPRSCMFLLCVSLLLCWFSSVSHGARIVQSLDVGWKVNSLTYNTSCTSPSNSTFPVDLTNNQCYGLNQATKANTPEACAQACCDSAGCAIWQWCTPGKACTPASSCWIGLSDECHPVNGWVGRGRPGPPRPSPADCDTPFCMPSYNDNSWAQRNVPHDFVIEGKFGPQNDQSHGYLPHGQAWYRHHFSVSSGLSNQAFSIQFDGVYRDSIVWLNGKLVGQHQSGYTSFDLVVTSLLKFGGADNVLVVFADATHNEGWWYEGGGIYRHVWLVSTSPVHFLPWGVYVPSEVIGPITNTANKGQTASKAMVHIYAEIMNEGTDKLNLQLTSSIKTSTGIQVGTVTTNNVITSEGTVKIAQNITLAPTTGSVSLWSAEFPTLYSVTTLLFDAASGTLLDDVTTSIGVRKISVDVNNGMFINDQPVKLKGLCNHQDFAGVGTAVPNTINKFRVQKLLDMGANAWRMSHNPPNPELLDFTDQLGMYVWDENRNFANNTQYLLDMRDMIRRDRNHPSVILWSVCNEAGCMENDPNGQFVGQAFKAIAYQNDYVSTRPVTAAMNADWGIGLSKVLDIQGVNYNYGEYDTYHTSHPLQPMIGSETASCTCARNVYFTNDTACHKDVYSADGCAQEWWSAVQERKFIEGGFAWTGYDYKGEPTPYGWPDVNSNFGILDIAGFPKDTFYYYQSWWRESSVLHVFPHWNWAGMEGKPIQVWAYTNAAVAELFLNGKSLGVQNVPHLGHVSWNVPYEAGSITVLAGNSTGHLITQQTIKTTGIAYAIVLEVESDDSIAANSNDAALIRVSVVDDAGLVVPTSTNMITFEVTGPGILAGLGNGDPACLEPDKGTARSAWGGLVRAVVQSTNVVGTATLKAASPGLKSAQIDVNTYQP